MSTDRLDESRLADQHGQQADQSNVLHLRHDYYVANEALASRQMPFKCYDLPAHYLYKPQPVISQCYTELINILATVRGNLRVKCLDK